MMMASSSLRSMKIRWATRQSMDAGPLGRYGRSDVTHFLPEAVPSSIFHLIPMRIHERHGTRYRCTCGHNTVGTILTCLISLSTAR